jgi:hypothetical protein
VATYPHGFTNQADIIGSVFDTNAVPLSWTGDGMAFFYDGARPGLTNVMHQLDAYTVKTVGTAQYPLPLLTKNYTLHISKNTGLMTGTFTDPNDKKTPSVSGVVLQNQAIGAGFFWKTNAGAFLLEQP